MHGASTINFGREQYTFDNRNAAQLISDNTLHEKSTVHENFMFIINEVIRE